MTRTGLITFHFAHHYGAQLQAYATMRAIQGLGHDCDIIDFRLPHTTATNQLFKRSGSVRDAAANTHTALHYGAFKARFDRFEAFVNEQMKLSPQRYTSFAQLKDNPPDYDVYVSGSDQIWNPYIYADKQFEPAFLLDFVRKGRRIAYAPSLGTPTLPAPYDEQFRQYLSAFDALSVREKRGQDLVRAITGREARVVLDPTLLLTGQQWGELAVAPKYQDYILCYFVSDPGEAAAYALALSEKTGLPIVQLAGARRKIPGAKEIVFDAGPREFLGLFQHASYVCTNSFHGAVFSVQFDRPFFTSMSPKERAEPTYSRIYSLLSRLGCAERIVGLDSTASIDAPMDYEAVHRNLDAARADSLAYLKAAVEGAELPPMPELPDPPKKPVLCKEADCTGCTACASVCPVGAISMEADHEGFLRPVVSDACVLCHKCEQTCPILRPQVKGPSPDCAHAVWNKDEAERVASSSGGFFSILARHVLDQGGAVFGTVLDETMHARHVCARSEEELAPMRGSKYVQSDLGDSFRQIKTLLDNGTPVLFSGVPCQVHGLLQAVGRDRDNLITCDLVCYGVPSPAVFRGFLDALEKKYGSKAVSVRFKDKSHGWSHPWFTVTFADGQVYTQDFNLTTYGRGFGMQLFLRPACARCQYTNTSRPADFTLADFWGLDEKVSLPVERDKGVSMVMVNSAKGQALFDALSSQFGQEERPLSEAVTGNPRLASPLTANSRRGAFFASLAARGYQKTEDQYMALPPLHYRAAAKILTPGMKNAIRKILK